MVEKVLKESITNKNKKAITSDLNIIITKLSQMGVLNISFILKEFR